MTKATFQFDFSELKLNLSQIEQVMGDNEGKSSETISEFISEVLNEAKSICRIRAEYAIFSGVKFNNAQKSVEINNVVFNIKKTVYGQIMRSDSIALFLCTAGDEVGNRSRKLMTEGDLLKGYIYDVIGSLIVEAAADIMQNALEKVMSIEGKKITSRYNPGYCGWDVIEQHKLFQMMPYNYCGIRLTPSALMNPVKSVSGFIGIGKNVKRNPYTCNLCDMKDCIYRRVMERD